MPYVKRNITGFLILMGLAIFVLFGVMILLMTRPAWPATPPYQQQYTCDDVRRLVTEKGKIAAIAFAVERGLSIRQIWQIRRICKV